MNGNGINIFQILLDFLWVPIVIPLIILFVKITPYVKEIKKEIGSEAEEFKKLYDERVKKNLRICSEEILQFINISTQRDIEHHLYICKRFNKTIGFIKFMYSQRFHYIFIAYAAIDKDDKVAKKYAIEKMLKKIHKKYIKTNKASILLTEIERSTKGGYLNSFAKLINRYARNFNMKAYISDFEYYQPAMPDDEFSGSDEEILNLIYITKGIVDFNHIPKEELITIIQFIYFEIYYPSCKNIKPKGYEDYESYMKDIIQIYKETLSDYIKLIPID